MNVSFPLVLNNCYALAFVKGRYKSSLEPEGQPASLVLYLCPDWESPFSLNYIAEEGKYLGYTARYEKEDPIDYVLLDAWYQFKVLPHYWILLEETEREVEIDSKVSLEYTKAYSRLRVVVSKFRWAEIVKDMVYGKKGMFKNKGIEKYETDRLFYPDTPSEIRQPVVLGSMQVS